MQFSIIHPSRNRPRQAQKVIQKWLSSAKDKSQIEYILSVDKTDKDLVAYKNIGIDNGIYVATNNNKSAIEAINKAAKVSTGRIIIVVSDDFDCPIGWDELLLKELDGKEDFLVKTKDGIQPTLITLPIMDRTYYNRFGYVYENGYKHLFCDEEMTTVGHMLGKVIDLEVMFEHQHYSTGKFKKDLISIKNNKTWNQGKKHFNERLKTNFGIQTPLIKHHEIKWQ